MAAVQMEQTAFAESFNCFGFTPPGKALLKQFPSPFLNVPLQKKKKKIAKLCQGCLLLFASNQQYHLHQMQCKYCIEKRLIKKNKASKTKKSKQRILSRLRQKHAQQCCYCGKMFSGLGSVNRHIHRVHFKVFCCLHSECGKVFGSRSDMMTHYQTHFKHNNNTADNNDINRTAFSKKHQCKDCCATFNNAKALHKHIDTCHHTAKSFVCLYCQKKFSRVNATIIINNKKNRRDSLQIHCLTHLFGKDERKIFQCETYGSKFTNKCNLRRHLKNFKKRHESIRTFSS
ncbi:zinc finger protein [Reticulomyxa filosa]|uniref:Zinc finger protein n=1 Tax=Reticulomyxa filosa TaxID=46433 RepID=X6MNK8_RETFI|nr:zinc finger protein [Reticulomyxa filosa]|eukprot:ETO14680.1 zinc finger protein [Reticulomyxa filosa]